MEEWWLSNCVELSIMDHVVGGKFKLGRKIGSGSFGELHLGRVLVRFFT